MRKKNVAILIPKLVGGGAERVASNLSIHLDEEKYNKYVVVYDSSEMDYPYGGKLINLNSKAMPNFFGKIYNLFKRIYKLKKFKKKYDIDVTISLLSGPNLVNILSRENDKIIVSVRNFISKSSTGFYGNIYKRLIKLFYNKADKVIPVSKAIAEDLVDNYKIHKEKISVIYNSYDIEKITKMSKVKIEKKYKYIFNRPTMVNMGRLSNQKGQWHLIRAFKKVKKKIKKAQLVILGKGGLEEYLRELVNDCNLNDSVHFLGFQNNPFKYIKSSQIFIFPSLFEGFPNALSEAMACGVPVISSDCKSGPREILAPNTDFEIQCKDIEYANYGILIPVLDGNFYEAKDPLTYEEKKLAQVVIEILNNVNLSQKYSKLSFERINNFKIDRIIKDWEYEI